MDTLLRTFNGDYHTKEALIAFITDFIGAEAVKRTFERKDVSHIADAKELIDKAFESLADTYDAKPIQQTPVSQSR